MKNLIRVLIAFFAFAIFLPSLTVSMDTQFNEIVEPENKRKDVVLIQISSTIKTGNIDDVKYIITEVLDYHDAGMIINESKMSRYEKFIYNYDDYMNTDIILNEENSLLRKGSTFIVKDLNTITDIEKFSGEARIICDTNCDEVIRDLQRSLQIDITQKEMYFNNLKATILIVPTTIGFTMLLSIMIIFELYKKYQLFSIQKLHGFSLKRIWIKESLPIVINQLIIMSTVYLISTLIFTNDFNSPPYDFALQGLKLISLLTFITFIVISIPILLFADVNFIEYLKGRTESKYFLHFNQITLSMMLLMSVVLLSVFSSTLTSYYSRVKNSEEWKRMEEYYIVPTFSGENLGNIPDDPLWRELTVEAFRILSEEGAIYADFNEIYYAEKYPEDSTVPFEVAYINSNYIDFHNLKDSDNNLIKIDNQYENHIILLPDDQTFTEKEIKDAYDYWAFEEGPKREIEFIYYDSSQSLFTHSNLIINEFSNSLSKIPLYVTTYKNMDFFGYDRIIGYFNNPFMIKANSVDEVEASLIKLGFNDTNFNNMKLNIISAYDDVNNMNQNERNFMIGILGIFIILLYLINQTINQSLESYLSIHKKEIAIKRMYGFPVIKVFTEYFKITGRYLLLNFMIIFLITRSIQSALQFSVLSIIMIGIFLILKLNKVYNSSLVSVFKGKEI